MNNKQHIQFSKNIKNILPIINQHYPDNIRRIVKLEHIKLLFSISIQNKHAKIIHSFQ